MPVLEFEQRNDTELVITRSTPPAAFFLAGDVAAEAKKEEYRRAIKNFVTHRYATFVLGGRKQKASVNKSLTAQEEAHKELLSISTCRDAKGRNFWLVHRSCKQTVPQVPPVDIDELNNDLDNLLS